MRVAVFLFFLLCGCDKIAHASVGAFSYNVDPSCTTALALGVAKEVVDRRTHRPEFLDAAATYIGCLVIKSEW